MPDISVGVSRAAYYDRNPVGVGIRFVADAIAPHVSTVRFTYTVPTGKKAFLQSALAHLARFAVAAPVGEALCVVNYVQAGVLALTVLSAELLTNAVGDKSILAIGSVGLLNPGDQITGTTVDASTGGSINYKCAFTAEEFDA